MSDLIDRQAAIDECMREDVISGYDAACLIAQLPLAEPEPEPHWTLCSERPPKDDTEVFVYLFDRPSPYIAWVNDSRWYTEEFEVEKEDYPKAWMPLPKPYQEENEEKDGNKYGRS